MTVDLYEKVAELISGRTWQYAILTEDSVVADDNLVPVKQKHKDDKLWVSVTPGTKVTDPNRPRGATRWLRQVEVVIIKNAKQLDKAAVRELKRFGDEMADFLADEGDSSITKSIDIGTQTFRRVEVEHEEYDSAELVKNTFVSTITVTFREM